MADEGQAENAGPVLTKRRLDCNDDGIVCKRDGRWAHVTSAHSTSYEERENNSKRDFMGELMQKEMVVKLRKYLKEKSKRDYFLCCIHKKNRVRKGIKSITNNKWFSWFISVIVIIHCILLAFVYQPYTAGDYKSANVILSYATIVFCIIYTIEACLKIIAMGLVMHPRSYLRSSINVFDAVIIIICFIASLFPNNRFFECLACIVSFRLIHILLKFETIQLINKALYSSMRLLMNLTWMILCITIFFALLGVELFKGRLHNGCYIKYADNDKYLVDEFPCTMSPINDTINDGARRCTGKNTSCDHWEDGPYSGLVGFDNIGVALLTVFQCITLEGWTSTLYLYESALGYYFVWMYFVILIIFGSIIVLNLFIGVMTNVFTGERDRQEAQGHYRKLKEKKKIKEDLDDYREWLREGGWMADGSKGKSSHSRSQQHHLDVISDIDEDEDEISDRNDEDNNDQSENDQSKIHRLLTCNRQLRSIVRHVLRSNEYFWFMTLIISVNFIMLLCDYATAPVEWTLALTIINYIFTFLYICEFLLFIYSYGPRSYFHKRSNYFSFILVIFNIIDILIFLPIRYAGSTEYFHFNISAIVNAIRAMKILLIFMYTRDKETVKSLMSTFTDVAPVIGIVMLLFCIFNGGTALLGMRAFGTSLTSKGDSHPSFNMFFDAFLLVFQLMTTEDWNFVMYKTASSVPSVNSSWSLNIFIAVYYVSIVIIGGCIHIYIYAIVGVSVVTLTTPTVIIANIFLAVAIDKLAEAKAMTDDSNLREEKREKKRKKKKEQLDVLKNPSNDSKITQTLRNVLTFYSANLKSHQQQQENWKRSNSVAHHPTQKRESFVLSRNVHSEDVLPRSRKEEGPLMGVVFHKVFSENPLSKFSKSFAVHIPKESVDTPTANEDLFHFDGVKRDMSNYGIAEEDDCEDLEDTGSATYRIESPHSIPLPTDVPIARLIRESSVEEIKSTSHHALEENVMTPHVRDKKCVKFFSKLKAFFIKLLHWVYNYFGTIELDPRKELKEIPDHSSFFILSPDNKFRVWSYKVVTSRPFVVLSSAVTILSSALLAFELPVALVTENQFFDDIMCSVQDIILFFDIAFILWYLLEFALKVISLGLFIHKGSYFRGLFNMIDFLITVSSVIVIVIFAQSTTGIFLRNCLPYSQNLPHWATFFRVLRALRPLRALRIDRLYLVIKGLFVSLIEMRYIFLFLCLVLLVFAVIGVQIFKGRFYYCTDPTTLHEDQCRGYYLTYPNGKLDCPQVLQRDWNKWQLNFDNIFISILTLFSMLTKEGWQTTMYRGIDSSGNKMGPIFDHSLYLMIYFVLFMLLIAIFFLNILVGSVIEINKSSKSSVVAANFDSNEYNCLYIALTSKPKKKLKPRFTLHKKLYQFIDSSLDQKLSLYQKIVFVSVLVNTFILAIQWYQQDDDIKHAIYWINIVFTILFFIEAIFVLVVLTPVYYFKNFFRCMELFIAVFSLLEFIFQRTLYQDSISFAYSHIFSSLRILRLVQFGKKSKLIYWTLVRSLEIFPWVGIFLIILSYTYAVVGMQLFGQLRAPLIQDSQNYSIHIYNNFDIFPQALLVMIRCFTGENWEQVMLSSLETTDCHDNATNMVNGTTYCGSDFAYIFYPSFLFISSIIVLNLFAAIIIDNFDYFKQDKADFGPRNLVEFFPLWAKLDDDNTGKIHHSKVIELMHSADPPLGWGKLCPTTICYKKMMKLNIPIDKDGMVTYNATLFAIVRVALKIEGSDSVLRNELQTTFPNMAKKTIDAVLPEHSDNSTGVEYGVVVIQQCWRKWKMAVSRRMINDKHIIQRVPDMGPALLQRRITLMNIGNVPGFETSPSHSPVLQTRSLLRAPSGVGSSVIPSNGSPSSGSPSGGSPILLSSAGLPVAPSSGSPSGGSPILLSSGSPVIASSVDSSNAITPLVKRTSQMIRLGTIDEDSSSQDDDRPASDFATPTGSLISLDVISETTV